MLGKYLKLSFESLGDELRIWVHLSIFELNSKLGLVKVELVHHSLLNSYHWGHLHSVKSFFCCTAQFEMILALSQWMWWVHYRHTRLNKLGPTGEPKKKSTYCEHWSEKNIQCWMDLHFKSFHQILLFASENCSWNSTLIWHFLNRFLSNFGVYLMWMFASASCCYPTGEAPSVVFYSCIPTDFKVQSDVMYSLFPSLCREAVWASVAFWSFRTNRHILLWSLTSKRLHPQKWHCIFFPYLPFLFQWTWLSGQQ